MSKVVPTSTGGWGLPRPGTVLSWGRAGSAYYWRRSKSLIDRQLINGAGWAAPFFLHRAGVPLWRDKMIMKSPMIATAASPVKERYAMSTDTTVIPFRQPDAIDDPLTEVAREGARRMLAQVLIAEADAFVALWKDLKLPDGRDRVVRHGHGPQRAIQTGVGPAPSRNGPARRTIWAMSSHSSSRNIPCRSRTLRTFD
jgi:hypothetical protein